MLCEADTFIVVDVLSFSTCVDIAVSQGTEVIPFPWGDFDSAAEEAARHGAELAGPRGNPDYEFNLSPPSLFRLKSGSKLVLPSPNGSRISTLLKDKRCFCGCLRNASSIARYVKTIPDIKTIAVVAAGERWPDRSLRVALEDLLGAGAIIDHLNFENSPEAEIARNAFLSAKNSISQFIHGSRSGRELTDRGYACDVEEAVKINVSSIVPQLTNGTYIRAN